MGQEVIWGRGSWKVTLCQRLGCRFKTQKSFGVLASTEDSEDWPGMLLSWKA